MIDIYIHIVTTTPKCFSPVLLLSLIFSQVVFGGWQGGPPNQRPWSHSHDDFMSLGFGNSVLISINKSMVGCLFIDMALEAGGLA